MGAYEIISIRRGTGRPVSGTIVGKDGLPRDLRLNNVDLTFTIYGTGSVAPIVRDYSKDGSGLVTGDGITVDPSDPGDAYRVRIDPADTATLEPGTLLPFRLLVEEADHEPDVPVAGHFVVLS